MAVVQNIQNLEWSDYSTNGKALVFPVVLDFTQFDEYEISSTGNATTIGNITQRATGVAIDNLKNAYGITLTVGLLPEYVPPFTKTKLDLPENKDVIVRASGDGFALLIFYTGEYAGSTVGTNLLEASKVAAVQTKTGIIEMWPGLPTNIPAGSMLCNGAELNRAQFSDLFSIVGTRYGAGDGATTFQLPNFLDRMPVGAGGDYALASKGGAKQHTLTAFQMFPHSHYVIDPGHSHSASQPAHSHGVNDPGHSHGINQTPHNHGLSDPGHGHGLNQTPHNHGLSDPGHAHGVTDPGHNHQMPFDTDGVTAPRNYPTRNGLGGNTRSALNYYTDGAATGISIQASGTGIGISEAYANLGLVNNGTGISLATSQANIGIIGNVTSITLQVAQPSVTVAPSTTGITTGSFGSGDPINHMPPYLGVYFIIWTGQT